MKTLLTGLALAATLLSGCAHDGWMADETERISETIDPREAPRGPDEETDPELEQELAQLRGPTSKRRTRRSSRGRWYVPRGCDDVAVRD